jgi:DNA-binding transcriptional regulator YhcF (GntR family)
MSSSEHNSFAIVCPWDIWQTTLQKEPFLARQFVAREVPIDNPRTVCTIVLVQTAIVSYCGLPVQLHISPHDGVPIYLQIVNQVKYLVASGRLEPGEELPAIRTLAEQLLVNPNTVARAYRELELAGVVVKRRTAGTYVSDSASPLARRQRLKIISERVDALLAEARQMNIDTDELIELIQDRDEAMQSAASINEKES